MIREENCRRCGKPLFKVVPLPPDGKNWAMYEKTRLEIKSDGDSFYECPHCKAKNIVIEEHPPGRPPQKRIIGWKE